MAVSAEQQQRLNHHDASSPTTGQHQHQHQHQHQRQRSRSNSSEQQQQQQQHQQSLDSTDSATDSSNDGSKPLPMHRLSPQLRGKSKITPKHELGASATMTTNEVPGPTSPFRHSDVPLTFNLKKRPPADEFPISEKRRSQESKIPINPQASASNVPAPLTKQQSLSGITPRERPFPNLAQLQAQLAGTNVTNPFPTGPVLDPPKEDDIGQPTRKSQKSVTAIPDETFHQEKQPKSRAISQTQLAIEVRGIYNGLAALENKCVNVVAVQSMKLRQMQADPSFDKVNFDDQWPALIRLHKELLFEHHDFLLASQHPAASNASKELARKYSMPSRMWKHGIHNLLELLRQRLPHSLEFMLNFIYLAYSVMALLYETVVSFRETWIECLGDLSRYRMAIEDSDMHTREIWTAVARRWYSMALNQNSNNGRLLHHLSILSRNQPLQQLSLYCQSLLASQPFLTSRDSIITLFDPIIRGSKTSSTENRFIFCHAILFTRGPDTDFDEAIFRFLAGLESHMGRVTAHFLSQGGSMAIANISCILKYGYAGSKIHAMLGNVDRSTSDVDENPELDTNKTGIDPDDLVLQTVSPGKLSCEWRIFVETLQVALLRRGDQNVLQLVHISLFFILRLSAAAVTEWYECMIFLSKILPWEVIADFLNSLVKARPGLLDEAMRTFSNKKNDSIEQCTSELLPEDRSCAGQIWCQGFLPIKVECLTIPEDDDRNAEPPLAAEIRSRRVLQIGLGLASLKLKQSQPQLQRKLHFDILVKRFTVQSSPVQ